MVLSCRCGAPGEFQGSNVLGDDVISCKLHAKCSTCNVPWRTHESDQHKVSVAHKCQCCGRDEMIAHCKYTTVDPHEILVTDRCYPFRQLGAIVFHNAEGFECYLWKKSCYGLDEFEEKLDNGEFTFSPDDKDIEQKIKAILTAC